MIYKTHFYEPFKVKATYCIFAEKGIAAEAHAILEPVDHTLPAEIQIRNIEETLKRMFSSVFSESMVLVWKRYFVTDAANQFQFLEHSENVATSIIQQPPLNGSKVSVWVYGIENVIVKNTKDGAICVNRPSYTHLYHTQLQVNIGDSFAQTISIFKQYIESLRNCGASLANYCIRTWLFVQNIDVQYGGMVNARKMIFDNENLTPETNYIASTGIEGRSYHPEVYVMLDAYAIPEINSEQVTFLKGTGYLNPTHEYGVTFERGTAVRYGDRQHVFISGTASINAKGEIIHLHDIQKQTDRTLENIDVLLAEAGCTMSDLAYLLVYLRDIADYKQTEAKMQAKFPNVPKIILLAPVCRPGWLIEIEGMAICKINDSRFKQF